MKHLSYTFMIFCMTAGTAQAACYADYKAKQDDPLRLHYGVTEVRDDCSIQSAEDQLRPALQRDGWQLLNVLGVFDDAGLEERRESAGDYFLRY
ncbi:hypothetical protein [Yoonia maritima]|uniref:hypothetical protein n=1 Tax=Yoonia maritima TaxID=1435347 RepID=UPI003735EEC0